MLDLAANAWITVAEPVPFVKPETKASAAIATEQNIAGRRRSSDSAYERLLASYNKLLSAVKANYGGTNKDLAKFTSQIQNLYDKWMR